MDSNSNSMLKILDNVRAGIEKPNAISNAVVCGRTSKLNVSFCKKFSPYDEDTFVVAIQHLQGDHNEGRL